MNQFEKAMKSIELDPGWAQVPVEGRATEEDPGLRQAPC